MTEKVNGYHLFNDSLDQLLSQKEKSVINTINAHSYIVAKEDAEFKNALQNSEILLPDGEGMVLMSKWLNGKGIKKIAGADLHDFMLSYANKNKLRCFYMGSSENTLKRIDEKMSLAYPNVLFGYYSPPFKPNFTEEDNDQIISAVNAFSPDVLFIGMTAPKQEKWANKNKERLNAHFICSIGAVFDFIAETKKRAPKWIIDLKMEWLYRSFTEWRLTKRYLYSTPRFMVEMVKAKMAHKRANK